MFFSHLMGQEKGIKKENLLLNKNACLRSNYPPITVLKQKSFQNTKDKTQLRHFIHALRFLEKTLRFRYDEAGCQWLSCFKDQHSVAGKRKKIFMCFKRLS